MSSFSSPECIVIFDGFSFRLSFLLLSLPIAVVTRLPGKVCKSTSEVPPYHSPTFLITFIKLKTNFLLYDVNIRDLKSKTKDIENE